MLRNILLQHVNLSGKEIYMEEGQLRKVRFRNRTGLSQPPHFLCCKVRDLI